MANKRRSKARPHPKGEQNALHMKTKPPYKGGKAPRNRIAPTLPPPCSDHDL